MGPAGRPLLLLLAAKSPLIGPAEAEELQRGGAGTARGCPAGSAGLQTRLSSVGMAGVQICSRRELFAGCQCPGWILIFTGKSFVTSKTGTSETRNNP